MPQGPAASRGVRSMSLTVAVLRPDGPTEASSSPLALTRRRSDPSRKVIVLKSLNKCSSPLGQLSGPPELLNDLPEGALQVNGVGDIADSPQACPDDLRHGLGVQDVSRGKLANLVQ